MCVTYLIAILQDDCVRIDVHDLVELVERENVEFGVARVDPPRDVHRPDRRELRDGNVGHAAQLDRHNGRERVAEPLEFAARDVRDLRCKEDEQRVLGLGFVQRVRKRLDAHGVRIGRDERRIRSSRAHAGHFSSCFVPTYRGYSVPLYGTMYQLSSMYSCGTVYHCYWSLTSG